MLEQRASLLLCLSVASLVGGVAWRLSALALLGAVALGALVSELHRLAQSARSSSLWGLRVQSAVVRLAADSADSRQRLHRVGQTIPLHFQMTCAPELLNLSVHVCHVVTTPGLQVIPEQRNLSIADGSGARLKCHAIANTAAVHHILGVHVVARDPLRLTRREAFLPCPLEFAALPRSLPLSIRRLPETRRQAPRRALGNYVGRRAGMGDELRELREHRPGDPFKHIAWKASARRRQLISKVFEQERAQAIYAIVDVGPSMRWGQPGRTALDQAMDLTHSLAEQAALASVPFAMSLTDCDYLVSVAPTVGYGAVERADRALLDARRSVHEAVTPLDEQVLVSKVAAYLQAIEGVEIPASDTRTNDVMRRQRTVMAALARLPSRERQAVTRGPDPSVRADLSILRRFCRCRGITLPYRQQIGADARVEGMVRALEQVRRARQGPFFVVLISDYLDFPDCGGPLWRALARASHGGHRGFVVALNSLSPGVAQMDAPQELTTETLGALRKSMHIRRVHELRRLERAARGVGAHFVGDPRPNNLAKAWTQALQQA